jgi:hypothetical protein
VALPQLFQHQFLEHVRSSDKGLGFYLSSAFKWRLLAQSAGEHSLVGHSSSALHVHQQHNPLGVGIYHTAVAAATASDH